MRTWFKNDPEHANLEKLSSVLAKMGYDTVADELHSQLVATENATSIKCKSCAYVLFILQSEPSHTKLCAFIGMWTIMKCMYMYAEYTSMIT